MSKQPHELDHEFTLASWPDCAKCGTALAMILASQLRCAPQPTAAVEADLRRIMAESDAQRNDRIWRAVREAAQS